MNLISFCMIQERSIAICEDFKILKKIHVFFFNWMPSFLKINKKVDQNVTKSPDVANLV